MHISFTGTQHGMTDKQMLAVIELLKRFTPDVVHHGDCLGADKQFHALCYIHGVPSIEVHPGVQGNVDKRAYCRGNVIHPPLPMMDRNDVLVAVSSILIVAPWEVPHEVCRHGTCATWRRGVKAGREICVVRP